MSIKGRYGTLASAPVKTSTYIVYVFFVLFFIILICFQYNFDRSCKCVSMDPVLVGLCCMQRGNLFCCVVLFLIVLYRCDVMFCLILCCPFCLFILLC